MTDLTAASLPEGFSVARFASARGPRGMLIVESGDLLVVERRGVSCVSVLWDDNGDGVSDANERACIASSAAGLNHGLAVSGGYLFASSDTTVFRWPYAGTERADLGPHTVVVQNINADGNGGAPRGHTTRTLVFDAAGLLYVSVGSNNNVDADSFRSRIRRFGGVTVADAQPAEFVDGEVWADGLRNEVGLAFDANGTLWGAELTRTPRGLRWVRTGYAYRPPALGTYPRRRAACPQGPTYCTHLVRVPASGVGYVPRTVAPQVGRRERRRQPRARRRRRGRAQRQPWRGAQPARQTRWLLRLPLLLVGVRAARAARARRDDAVGVAQLWRDALGRVVPRHGARDTARDGHAGTHGAPRHPLLWHAAGGALVPAALHRRGG